MRSGQTDSELLHESRQRAKQVLAESARRAQALLDDAHREAVRLLLEQQNTAAELLLVEGAEAADARQAVVGAAEGLSDSRREAALAAHDRGATLLLERQEAAAQLLIDAQQRAAAILGTAVDQASADILMAGQKEAAAILLEARMRVEYYRLSEASSAQSGPVTASQNEHQARLIAIVSAIPWLMDALALVRDMSLSRWCIGAGAIRNTVWAHLLGSGGEALPEGDVDVAYFDPACTDPIRDAQIRGELEKARPGLHWDVVNQAGVHRWYEAEFGEPHAPYASLEEAVGSWPERATCIGVSLAHDGSLQVIAPLGLPDLFGLVIARNPQVSETVYRRRLADKRFDERWPEVTVLL